MSGFLVGVMYAILSPVILAYKIYRAISEFGDDVIFDYHNRRRK